MWLWCTVPSGCLRVALRTGYMPFGVDLTGVATGLPLPAEILDFSGGQKLAHTCYSEDTCSQPLPSPPDQTPTASPLLPFPPPLLATATSGVHLASAGQGERMSLIHPGRDEKCALTSHTPSSSFPLFCLALEPLAHHLYHRTGFWQDSLHMWNLLLNIYASPTVPQHNMDTGR